jgi:hypothetical protein
MPRARRRRHRAVAKRGWGRLLLLTLLGALGVVLVVGSLVEIHNQSQQFRTSTTTGYGALATRVVDSSNQTGTQLAVVIDTAPQLSNQAIQLPNQTVPYLNLNLARAQLQQGLDQAVSSSTQDASRAAHLVPPAPVGDVSTRFTQVMTDRATAASDIRAAIDQRLGMTPLPVAGAPASSASSAPSSAAPLISIDQAASALSAAGSLLEQADRSYGALVADLRRTRTPIHLPTSAWVPSPVDASPLGAARLGASASLLSASVPLTPFHQMIFTAVGLVPPAVSSPPAAGVVGTGCRANPPVSTVPGSVPTVMPPTGSVSAAATVTNCGTVVESGVGVSETLALADPPGTAPPAAGARGGTSQTTVTLRPGSSIALSLPPSTVAGGHRYLLTLAIAISPTQVANNPGGSTQQFLLQISS